MVYDEHSLIPFEAWTPVAERALIIAPHPDDEVIGCGGLITTLATSGRSVTTLVVTDGAAGGEGASESLVSTRQDEVRAGLSLLGAPDVRFLGFPDRGADAHSEEIARAIEEIVRELEPDLIAIPSLVEIHPDHAAVAEACVMSLQRDSRLPSLLPLTDVAFYEVSQPIAPNRLLDITPHAELKQRAISEHASQLEQRSYAAYADGLNRYRSMTLGPGATHAEAFWVVGLEQLSLTPSAELARRMAPTRRRPEVAALDPVAIVIRTRDRLVWLGEAVASALASTHPVEVIVVNDGGASPGGVLPPEVRLIDLAERSGRSAAMNRGVEAAQSLLVCFLDDDDLISEDHVMVLARAMRSASRAACYSDGVSVTLTRDASGEWSETRRERVYSADFDRNLLLIDNYIPLNSVIVRRSDFLELGGFDPALDLFEDWDFLLRLSARGDFDHVPRVTCTIRHFEGSGSLIQQAAADASRLARGKAAIWKRHGVDVSHEAMALVVEQLKRQVRRSQDHSAIAGGERAHALRAISQLERDKQTLIVAMGTEIHRRDEALAAEQATGASRLEEARREISSLRTELERALERLDETGRQRDDASRERDKRIEESHRLWGEINRLNALLEEIYASRTWKLHTTLERLKGRG